MAQFNLTAKLTITTFTTVEAETLEDALKIAEQRTDMMSISSNNGDEVTETWMIYELDGVPYEIKKED